MITCVSSNMSTQKSSGNDTNQDEREEQNASKDSQTKGISATHNLFYDNETGSNPSNENLLSGKSKINFSSSVSGFHKSLKSNLTNEKEVSLITNQDTRKIFAKPISNTAQSSEYELPTDQQQSDAEEDGSEPILDSETDIGTFRSNSFRDIKTMLPRGYGKMDKAELTKTDSKATVNLGHINNSENSNENSLDYGTNLSEVTSHMLEEMQRRHAETWKLLGYDPTHGKGDMRGSATLANFSPLKLIRQSKLFAQNSCSETNFSNSSGKQVIQSYSLCVKPSYRTLKRVNSSNGPLSNLVDENCGDQDEDENQELNSPSNQNKHSQKKDDEDDFIPPNSLTIESLLNGPNFFKDDDSEEYYVLEEEEEEEEEFEEEEFEEEEESQIENVTDAPNEENLKQNKVKFEQKNDENSTDLEKQTKE